MKKVLTGDHNKCPGCGKYFKSTHAFDKHRTGEHKNNQRRCLTEDEMLEKGMVLNKNGWWVGSAMSDSVVNARCESMEHAN